MRSTPRSKAQGTYLYQPNDGDDGKSSVQLDRIACPLQHCVQHLQSRPEHATAIKLADINTSPAFRPVTLPQGKYDRDVRRILAVIEAKEKVDPREPPGGEHTSTTRPETSPSRRCGGGDQKSTTKHRSQEPHSWRKARNSSRSGSARSGTGSEPLHLSARSSALSSCRRNSDGNGHGAESASVDAVDPAAVGDVRRGTASRPRQQGTRNCQGSLSEEPEAPTPRPMITGAAAVVAGGPRTKREPVTVAASASVNDRGAGNEGDISPGTAKKVLPHFLAIGNPGNQALVAKEGAEIVQRQVRGQ